MQYNSLNNKELLKISDSNTPYNSFAAYYDHYMRHVDYDAWTDKVISLFNTHSNLKLKDIMELACGTANISERLVARGYNVIASDQSIEMLQIASLKHFKPTLTQADMTDELVPESYDLILLMFDSINYLMSKVKINQLFQNCKQGLKKGGLLIFDISTIKNSLENFNHFLNIDDTPEATIIHKADFDVETRIQKTFITIFLQKEDIYVRTDEIHKQQIYITSDLISCLNLNELDVVGLYSLNGMKNLIKQNLKKIDYQYSRLFFVSRRTS